MAEQQSTFFLAVERGAKALHLNFHAGKECPSGWDDAAYVKQATAVLDAAGVPALLDVAEAAQRLAARDGHANDYCTDCELGGHVAPCPWIALDAALEKLPQKEPEGES